MSSRATKIFRSFSPRETGEFGERLARAAAAAIAKRNRASGNRGALVFALTGDLGAGKTTFAQGFLKGLRAKGRAVSPTFVIMRRYALPRRRRKGSGPANVFHIDAYRLKSPADLAALGFPEIAASRENIVLIEWADKVRKFLPRHTIWFRFRHGRKEHEREVVGGAAAR